ncbi:hypothetical protein [Pseudonocardia sediminis]|uniref:hypothetical protein n=1 Tax=Pseudonocardia sediminis TaxID=1397368 RepID=UPI001028A2D5|nr:hypothetical protein [Pseudonocardia sediminis]
MNASALPALASRELGTITAVTATTCPELPPVWVLAHVEAESGWDSTAFSRDVNGGAAGLYQLNEANWRSAGGSPWPGTPPAASSDVLQPDVHLRRAIPWVCDNLRIASAHLRATRKPTPPLDAMLVCHIAGCGRVTGSKTGVPTAGEAGCDAGCADLVSGYIERVHALVDKYSAAAGGPGTADLPAPAPASEASTGCTADDPTGGRCLTPTTRHAYDEIARVFGLPGKSGGTLRSAGCWDAHAWNPTSDHPQGRACDFFPTAAGRFPEGQELQNGWRLAEWLRAHASELKVSYIIWQGRIWTPGAPDENGWGRPYNGGGVYDPNDATGGHYDHVHLSVSD